MSTIVTRAGKGSPLTNTEVDANFDNLNNDKYQEASVPTFGDVTIQSSSPQIFFKDTDGNQIGTVTQNNNLFITKSQGETSYGGYHFKLGSPAAGEADKFAINVSDDSSVRLYNTTGQARFFWDAANVKLKIGAGTAPSEVLDVLGNIKSSNNVLAGGSVESVSVVTTGDITAGTNLYAKDLFLGDSSPLITLTDTDNGGMIGKLAQQQSNLFMSVTGDGSHGQIQFFSNNGTDSRLRQSIGANGDLNVYQDDGATVGLKFKANTGRLGIGTVTPAAPLDVVGNANVSGEITCDTLASGVSTFTKSGDSGIIAEFYNDTTKVGFIKDRSELVSSLVLDPRTNGVGISATSNALIPTDLNGNLNTNLTNLGNVANKWKDLFLGGGVYLGGSTDAANKLDDYEEGTWTPTYTASTTSPVYTAEQTNGYYVKVGSLVTLTGRIKTSNITNTPAGDLRISGFPFTPINTSGGKQSGSVVVGDAKGFATGFFPSSGVVQDNAAFAFLNRRQSAAGNTLIIPANSALQTGSNLNDLSFSITYRTDS